MHRDFNDPSPLPPAGGAQQRATRLTFLASGLSMATWAPLVPFAKERLGIDDAVLGLLLLCLGGGSIITMPLAGALAARIGCRSVIIAAGAVICVCLPVLGSVAARPLFIAALLLFGAGMGAIDVAMNVQAIQVERASGRAMMSGFHGLYSLGGIVGAGAVSALFGLGASPLQASLAMAICDAVLILLARPHLLPATRHEGGRQAARGKAPAFALPHGPVALLGALCFVVFLTEGSVLDWSALFLGTELGAPPALAGLGYAAFSTTMTVGRLTGDRVVHRFGGRRVVLAGGLVAALGFALVVAVPTWQAGLIGYALVGAGCANIVPVLFTAVGRQRAMPESTAVPAMTTLGYAGLLMGPAAVGLLAHAFSLRVAFILILSLLFGVAACARRLPSGHD